MKAQTVVGIYDSVGAAERARDELVAAGVAQQRISVSAGLTQDAIGAEAPGQSYENQGYRAEAEDDIARERYAEAVRSGACILSVAGVSRENAPRIHELLRRSGARGTRVRPA